MLPSSGQEFTVRAQIRLSQHPLKNAGVLPTGRNKMTVVMQKGNIGHMAAVPTIDVAGSPWLRTGVRKQVHFAKIISGGKEVFVM